MRKTRIISWIICLVVATLIFKGPSIFQTFSNEKTPLYVYAPSDMEDAFKRALKCADMKKDYKIVMTEEKAKASLIVQTEKESDTIYRIAYTPFIVAYAEESKNNKKLEEAEVIIKPPFFEDQDEEYYEIDVLKVIEEVLEEGKWENFGIEDMGDIKIYYPHKDSPYWKDFYDFMLVTANYGSYPEIEIEMELAQDKIKRFLNSEFTEAVLDFDEKLERNGGFRSNAFYFIPEKLIGDLAGKYKEDSRIYYPTATIYCNYYIKTVDDLGKKMLNYFEDKTFWGNFYEYLTYQDYRTPIYSKIENVSQYVYGESEIYNVCILEDDRIQPLLQDENLN